MKKYFNETNIGTFTINGVDYIGGLSLKGEETSLTIWGEDQIVSVLSHNLPDQIHGTFSDLKKITLLDLVSLGSGSHSNEDHEVRYYSEVFPHHILFGDRYIEKDENSFEALEFVVSHSTSLFFSYPSSFQEVIHTNKGMVETLLAEDFSKSKELYDFISDNDEKDFKVGNHPIISIYTGRNPKVWLL